MSCNSVFDKNIQHETKTLTFTLQIKYKSKGTRQRNFGCGIFSDFQKACHTVYVIYLFRN